MANFYLTNKEMLDASAENFQSQKHMRGDKVPLKDIQAYMRSHMLEGPQVDEYLSNFCDEEECLIDGMADYNKQLEGAKQ